MTTTPASRITANRIDMTDWVLHFVHQRDIRNSPTDMDFPYEEYQGLPYHEDPKINQRFGNWDYMDEYLPLEPDASPMGVLHRIITDGHIRASWALRKGRPTVYGPRAAVCFTEMPLYGLVDYAKRRRETDVDCYAVGLLKSELFAAGGRPVIYGLTGAYKDQTPGSYPWPRKLDQSCGIAEPEQYRYVAMAADADRPIDWSHEREWRWADHPDRCWCPGVPIWLKDKPFSFSRVFVVVPTTDEAERVLDLLKQLYDSQGNGFCVEFDTKALYQTQVISLEQLRDDLPDNAMRAIRLEDIPSMSIRRFEVPPATPEDIAKLTQVMEEAKQAAINAAQHKYETTPKNSDGHILDLSGFASLTTHDSQSPLVSALLALDSASALGDDGYSIGQFGNLNRIGDQALCLKEAGVDAAMEVFKEHYPKNSFGMRSRMD